MTDKQHNISNIESNLKSFKNKLSDSKKKESDVFNNISATKILLDLLSGLGVGILIGYFLDIRLGTEPIFIFLCTILGISGGFLNFYRDFNKKEK